MNAVVYHGTAESRQVIRAYEWIFDECKKDKQPLYKVPFPIGSIFFFFLDRYWSSLWRTAYRGSSMR
jgi:hypothetical protein